MRRPTYQQTMFPLMEAIILRLHQQTGSPVTHDEIAEAYRQDSVVQPELVRRQNTLPQRHTLEWLASNDVQWFSAKFPLIAVGRFTRFRVSGKWAYVPVSGRTTQAALRSETPTSSVRNCDTAANPPASLG